MRKSYIVEVDGIFAGAAIPQNNGKFRFVPVDGRMHHIRDCLWSTLGELQREVRQLLGSRRDAVLH